MGQLKKPIATNESSVCLTKKLRIVSSMLCIVDHVRSKSSLKMEVPEWLACSGVAVETHGLSGLPALNGCRGVTNGRVQDGRVGVEFPAPHGTKVGTRSIYMQCSGGARPRPPQTPFT